MRKSLCLLVSLLGFGVAFGQAPTGVSAADEKRAEAIVGKMTLEQELDYIGGIGFAVRPVPQVGLPILQMSDGPFGVRSNEGYPSTLYGIGAGLAASWDVELAERVGGGIGRDARARGIHFMLGPGVNIYRSPLNGRNFEYFGEDPFLTSGIAVSYIRGMQKEGVSATIKHFLANNSEYLRHDSDSIVDERTLREIYLPSFEAAVKQAKVGAIMDSYNLINGTHATQDSYFNTQIARKEWGFDGVMMSDWVATYDGVGAANGGLDIEMPTGAYMNGKVLGPAIADGKVTKATIDEKVRHIVQTAARFGWLDRPAADATLSTYSTVNHELALQAAREGIVLLKNDGNLLPLDKTKVKTVLVVGPDAFPGEPVGAGSARVHTFFDVSGVQGIATLLGAGVTTYYQTGVPSVTDAAGATEFVTAAQNGQRGVRQETFENLDLSGTPAKSEIVKHINEAGSSWEDLKLDMEGLAELFSRPPRQASNRWTGYYVAGTAGKYEIAAQGSGEGGGYRVYLDDKLLFDNWKLAIAYQSGATLELSAGPHKIVAEEYVSGPMGGRLRVAIAEQSKVVSADAKAQAAKADVVIVLAGFNNDSEGEAADRTFALPFGQVELIRELSAANKNVIVAVTSGGNVDAMPWIGGVRAYLQTWYGGESGGTALAEVLTGAFNPSGHLPATFEKRWEDNPAYPNYYPEPGTVRVAYREGIFVGYRGYERNKVEPLYPFGYGLSYTTFAYSNLNVAPAAAGTTAASGRPALYTVSFDVKNTGTRAGADVAQLYVGENQPKVARPGKELKGFARVELAAGETKHVTLQLDARAFTYYDSGAKHWQADAGGYTVRVGRSSAELPLSGAITLAEAISLGNDK